MAKRTLTILLAALLSLLSPVGYAGFSATATMSSLRAGHTAVRLPNGDVLVVGSNSSANPNTAEKYVSASQAWIAAASISPKIVIGNTGNVLPDGRIFVAGGWGPQTPSNLVNSFATAWLYNAGADTVISAGVMSIPRAEHTATLLPNGKVLIVGGVNYQVSGGAQVSTVLGSAELFDPVTGVWSSAGSMSTVRHYHSAVLLGNGKVLVIGGYSSSNVLASAELYDPSTNSWSIAGQMQKAHGGGPATVLNNGKVLIVGGNTAELYDPANNTWSYAASPFLGRDSPSATLLQDGRVLMAGGSTKDGVLASAEIYNPISDTWASAGNMTSPRLRHTATLLGSGQVLLAGGESIDGGPGALLATAELYNPDGPATGSGTIVSNPYGPLTVLGGTINGNTISNLQQNVTIQLGNVPGSSGSFLEIDFDGFNIANGRTLTIKSGGSGQTVLIRNTSTSAAVLAGLLQAQAGNGASAPKLHLLDSNGMTIASTSTILAQSGLTIDTLGSTFVSGNKLLNQGWIDGGPSLVLRTGGVTGGGGFAGNAITVSTFGDVRNPVNGAHYLSNGVQLFPSSGGTVALTLNDYGSSPQFINVMVNGSASLLMPSSWGSVTTMPPNNASVPAGSVRPAGGGEPSFGGGSMILQATGNISVVGGVSNDFVFPGAIVLKATGTLDLDGVTFNQGWTTTGRAFQGVFFESPNIVSASPVTVLSNNLNWTNFSTLPNGHFQVWTLVQKPDGTSQYNSADSVAPHLNTYSTLIEAAANGQCWTCLLNYNTINVQ
ncbi:MAG: kelch repeat-containing protein [Burkholderiales bacterium]